MEYHINNQQGDTIASFLHESDRDHCKETFEDMYDDCEFFAVNGEAT